MAVVLISIIHSVVIDEIKVVYDIIVLYDIRLYTPLRCFCIKFYGNVLYIIIFYFLLFGNTH